jgi:hypothetical protein
LDDDVTAMDHKEEVTLIAHELHKKHGEQWNEKQFPL